MRSKRIFIFLSVILPICLALFIFLNQTKLPSILFNKTKVEYDENGLVKVKPKDKVENLIKDGNFQQGLSQEWKIFPPEKKDLITTELIVKPEDQEYNVLTYVNDSSLKVETKEAGVGLEQKLDFKQKDIPHFLQTNVLVLSGEVKMTILNASGEEVASTKVKAQENISKRNDDELQKLWQTMSIKIEKPDIAERVMFSSMDGGSTYLLTNIVLHEVRNYSPVLEGLTEDSVTKYISKCEEAEKDDYLKCINQITGLTPDKWGEFGKPTVSYYGKTIEEAKVLGLTNEQDIQTSVKKIFITPDFQPGSVQKAIRNSRSWENEQIIKEISFEGAEIVEFDPTIEGACKIEDYWIEGLNLYFPDEWCSDGSALMYAFSNVGSGFFMGNNKVFAGDGSYFVAKHETGHFFGAPDSDFVEIIGDAIYPMGNSKRGTQYDDVMYSVRKNVSDYTKLVINNSDQRNHYLFQKKELSLVDKTSGFPLSDGQYWIYMGRQGPAHFKGAIENYPEISGTFTGGVIRTDSPVLKDGYPVAFILAAAEGNVYHGKFDILDMTTSYFADSNALKVVMVKTNIPYDAITLGQCKINLTFKGYNLEPEIPISKICLKYQKTLYNSWTDICYPYSTFSQDKDEMLFFSSEIFDCRTEVLGGTKYLGKAYLLGENGEMLAETNVNDYFGCTYNKSDNSCETNSPVFDFETFWVDYVSAKTLYIQGILTVINKAKLPIGAISVQSDLSSLVSQIGLGNDQESILEFPYQIRLAGWQNQPVKLRFLFLTSSISGNKLIWKDLPSLWLQVNQDEIYDNMILDNDYTIDLQDIDGSLGSVGCRNEDGTHSPIGTGRCMLGDRAVSECREYEILGSKSYVWTPAALCTQGESCLVGKCQITGKTCDLPDTCKSVTNCPVDQRLQKRDCRGDTLCCASTPIPTQTLIPVSVCHTNSCDYAGGVCAGDCPESQNLGGDYGCLDGCGEPYCCELIPTPTTGSSFGGLMPTIEPTPLPTKVPTPTLTPVPTNTPTPVPQFSLCNNCEALGLGCPRPNECRVVNDAALCAKYNQNSTPCCLWDTENCRAGGYTPVCGAEVGKYPLNVIPDYCNKCHRSYQSDPWCPEQWDQTCGAGAPAYPRTKSPPNGFNVNLNQPDFSLSWYSFGEGFKRQCGEILPKEYRKWDTCNGTWKFDSRAQCIPYTDGQNSSDRDCWGYVCARGSFGIPTDWRFYEVFMKKPGEQDFTSLCKITNIPNPPISKQDWIGTIPGEKKSCPFIPDKQGEYQWYVRAGYQLTTAGGGFTQHADSPVARFKVGELTLKAVCQYEANGETKINVSWDPAPNALKYALRFNNLANPEFINCSNNYSPAGDICLDNIRTNSYSKQVTPNQSYSWWIHQIDSGNIWGPPIYGKDFICQPPTATVVPQATNTSVPVPTTIIVPATAVPTITPVPTPYGQCMSCKIFSAEPGNLWWEITPPLSIKKGQKVFLATRGELTNTQTQNLKARFRVNNTANNSWCTGEGLTLSPGDNSNQVWCETTLKHEDYFYVPYTFNQAGKQTIQSMLFNVETGWY